MTVETLKEFFMWCSIVNGGLLTFWALFLMFAPELVYRIQSYWFPMAREHFNMIIYGFLGLFKVFFLFFNLVPYLALVLIS